MIPAVAWAVLCARHRSCRVLLASSCLWAGGSIVPRKERVRRSSTLMARDPITLVVSLDSSGAATGELYLDDGSSFEYQQGAYAHRTFSFSKHMFSSRAAASTPVVAGGAPPRKGGAFSMPNNVERIVVQGLTSYALWRSGACVFPSTAFFHNVLAVLSYASDRTAPSPRSR